jgi:hypothetical protein
MTLPFAALLAAASTPSRPDDPVSFAAILLLGLGLMALAIGRPVPKR